MKITRTSWQVVSSVWYALFLREMVGRTSSDRFAWFWMIFEPFALITILASIRSLVSGTKLIAGAEFIPWIIVGLFGFYLFRENMLRSLGAVKANKSLFAYRQVKPIDPVLIRCFIEGLIRSFIFILFMVCAKLIGIDVIPDQPLQALFLWILLWLLGVGYGLTFSALTALIPEIARLIKLTSLPLIIISGVMFPIQYLPISAQQALLFNPIVHGLDLLRLFFFNSYAPVTGISILYLTLWILALNALGLSLHIRFSLKLKAQ